MKKPGFTYHKTDTQNTTGRVGISLWTRVRQFRDGRKVVRRWYAAKVEGRRVVLFSLDALGKAAAFREAVRQRERWEREVNKRRDALAPVRRQAAADWWRAYRQRKGRAAYEPAQYAAYYRKNSKKIRAKRRAYYKRRGKSLEQQRRAAK